MEPASRKHHNDNNAYAHGPNSAKRVCLSRIPGSARNTSGSGSGLEVATEEVEIGHQRADRLWQETAIPLPDKGTPPSTASIPPKDQSFICYGALFEVQAAIDPPSDIAHCKELIQDPGPMQQYQIHIRHDGYWLWSARHGNFAAIDTRTASALSGLQNLPHISLVAVLCSNVLRQKKRSRNGLTIIPLSINVCGPYMCGDKVGETLGRAEAFLQHPNILEADIEYYNPQFYYPDDKLEPLTHLVGMAESDFEAKILSREVEIILASLGDHESDMIFDSDINLSDISTELRRHQQLALRFMHRHENGSEVMSLRKDIFHILGIPKSEKGLMSCTGGILADVMGLGKSLSVLALVSSTLQTASTYQSHRRSAPQDCYAVDMPRSRASLVVVTSAQMLDSWVTEIRKHFRTDAFKVLIFHGDRRPRTKQHIVDHDIVLTTYATLVADCKSSKALQSIAWFRIVLDEAHWIRNQTSQQFKALNKIHSQRKWCLTGTPIQNRIDDLISLLHFLEFEPLCNGPAFQKYILDPLGKESADRTKPLQALLRGVCLRRDESWLNLPSPFHQTVEIRFDINERSLYNGVLNACQRDLDNVVSGQSKSKNHAILFAAIMKLRRLCNHGTVQLIGQGLRSNPNTPVALDSSCEYCQGNQEESLAALNKETICSECGRSLQRAQARGPLTPEGDVSRTPTPADFMEIDQDYNRSQVGEPTNPGSSSKLRGVIDTLAQNLQAGKSLVFSYWTSTLDILKHMLMRANIPCLMIDGRVPYTERPRILEQFRQDENVRILLMSIQTGAVGLNLTAANFIHIVEPQWNPSIEEQAIGRALRMGQTRTVTVFRYVVQSSIEQNIQTLQKKKRNLAKFTLDGSGTETGSLEDFKFMLDM